MSSVSIRLMLEEPTVSNIPSTSSSDESEKIVQNFLQTFVKHVRVIYETCMRLSSIITRLHDNSITKEHVGIINSASDAINLELKRIQYKNGEKWSKDPMGSDIKYAFDYIVDCMKEINREIVTTDDTPQTFDAVVDLIDFRCTKNLISCIEDAALEEDVTFGKRMNNALEQFNNDLGKFVNGPGLQKLETKISNDFKKMIVEIDRDKKAIAQYAFSTVPEQRILDKISDAASTIAGSTTIVDFLKSTFNKEEESADLPGRQIKQILDRVKNDLTQLTQLSSTVIEQFFDLLKPDDYYAFKKFLSAPERILKNFYLSKYTHLKDVAMRAGGDGHGYHRNVITPISMLIDNAGYIVKTFESYIKKTNKAIDKVSTATGKSLPLGKLAFPGSRLNKKLPIEPNTRTENELFNDLVAHFEGEELLSKEKSDLVRKFLQNGNYHDVFKEPDSETVYRGMSVKSDWLVKALKLKSASELGANGSLAKSFTFTPNRGGSSWTSDKKIARDFGHNNAGSDFGTYVVILHAEVDKNPNRFITGPGGLYNVDGFDAHTHEKESIGLGPIKVSKITWEK